MTLRRLRTRPCVVAVRAAMLALALTGGAASCSSGDDPSASPGSAEVELPTGGADDASTSESLEPQAEANEGGEPGGAAPDASQSDEGQTGDVGSEGGGIGTIAMTDGTVYPLMMTTCDTSENGAAGLELDDTYDLFGRTSDDAFRAQFIRAGFDEDSVVEAATLEGDFDADGQNASMLYSFDRDTLALTVDGGAVSGTVTLKAIGPTRPHGDEIEATIDIRC